MPDRSFAGKDTWKNWAEALEKEYIYGTVKRNLKKALW